MTKFTFFSDLSLILRFGVFLIKKMGAVKGPKQRKAERKTHDSLYEHRTTSQRLYQFKYMTYHDKEAAIGPRIPSRQEICQHILPEVGVRDLELGDARGGRELIEALLEGNEVGLRMSTLARTQKNTQFIIKFGLIPMHMQKALVQPKAKKKDFAYRTILYHSKSMSAGRFPTVTLELRAGPRPSLAHPKN